VIRDWELPEDLTASSFARECVRSALSGGAATEETVDDAQLIASELAANAIRYGSPPYALAVDVTDERVRITVSNHGSTDDPQVIDAEIYAHHGRGLAIISALADRLGWDREGDRLDVWADLPVASPTD